MIDMTRAAALAVECTTLTNYLVGEDPAVDVVAAYQRAHEVSTVEANRLSSPALDRALLRIAHLGPRCARAADGYAAAFAKTSALRRKLVLLIAILESRGETASRIDSADPGSRILWWLDVGARIGVCVTRVGLAALLIVPLCVWYRVVDASGE